MFDSLDLVCKLDSTVVAKSLTKIGWKKDSLLLGNGKNTEGKDIVRNIFFVNLSSAPRTSEDLNNLNWTPLFFIASSDFHLE